MLKSISKTFLTGLITILPIAFTLYFLYWLVVSAEAALGSLIRLVIAREFVPAWNGLNCWFIRSISGKTTNACLCCTTSVCLE